MSDKMIIDSSTFFKSILKNSQISVMLLMDTNGVVLDTNVAVNRSLGYTHDELIGKNFAMLFIPEDRLKAMPEIEIANVLEKGSASDNNYLLHKDGAYIWVNGESILFKDGANSSYILKLIVDINQQKLLQNHLIASNKELSKIKDELVHNNEELLKLNKELEMFVYMASHDLKTPINHIEAMVNMIDSDMNDGNVLDVNEQMEIIRSSIQRFKTTISDLGTMGKDENDKTLSLIDLKEIFDEVILDLKELIGRCHANITADFSLISKIYYSKKNMRSILYNVLSNAVKYHSPDRIPTINVISKNITQQPTSCLIEIQDNGLGMKKEEAERIFLIYERFHNHVDGTGVGMSIVKKIIQSNDGNLEVSSVVNEGTLVKIILNKVVQ